MKKLMLNKLSKFGILILVSWILTVVSIAQAKTCDLRLNIIKYEENVSNNPVVIEFAKTQLTNLESKKDEKSAKDSKLPYFQNLSEGRFVVRVSKTGYKETIKFISLYCANATNRVISENIILWEGNSKEKVHFIDKDFENQTLLKYKDVMLDGLAIKVSSTDYPRAAQAVRAQGSVPVEIVIDEQGSVISARAVGGHPLLREEAEKAAKRSKFAVSFFNGKPAKIKGTVVYKFRIE